MGTSGPRLMDAVMVVGHRSMVAEECGWVIWGLSLRAEASVKHVPSVKHLRPSS